MTTKSPMTVVPAVHRHVVVAVTGSSFFDTTFKSASLVARAVGAEVHVVHVTDVGSETGRDMRDYLLRHADEELRSIGIQCVNGELEDPADAIERFTGSLEGAIACVGCHAYRGLDLLLGSVTEDLLRRPEPLLVIGPNSLPRTPRRVAVCLDGSEWAETMVEEGARWAAAMGLPLWLVQALDPSAAAPSDDVMETNYLQRVAARWRQPGLDVEWETVHDRHADRALLRWLHEEPATMVVAATHGRSGFRRGLLGGVANHLVREALGPVVLRRPLG